MARSVVRPDFTVSRDGGTVNQGARQDGAHLFGGRPKPTGIEVLWAERRKSLEMVRFSVTLCHHDVINASLAGLARLAGTHVPAAARSTSTAGCGSRGRSWLPCTISLTACSTRRSGTPCPVLARSSG